MRLRETSLSAYSFIQLGVVCNSEFNAKCSIPVTLDKIDEKSEVDYKLVQCIRLPVFLSLRIQSHLRNIVGVYKVGC